MRDMIKAVQGAVRVAAAARRIGALAVKQPHPALVHGGRIPDIEERLIAQIPEARPLGPILRAEQHVAVPIDGELIGQVMADPRLIDFGLMSGIDRAAAIGQLQAEIIGLAMPAIAQRIIGIV